MELVYLWVEDYKNIHKQGFNFSPRFNCHYDETINELTIDENKEYINIFPENINVTAIVGKNGAGKSSLFKLALFLIFCKNYTKESPFNIGKLVYCLQPFANKELFLIVKVKDEFKKISFSSFICHLKEIEFGDEITTTTMSGSDPIEKKIFVNKNELQELRRNELDFFTIHFNYMIDTFYDGFHDRWVNYIYHRVDRYNVPLLLEPYKGHEEDNNYIDISNIEYLNNGKIFDFYHDINKNKQINSFFNPDSIWMMIDSNKILNKYESLDGFPLDDTQKEFFKKFIDYRVKTKDLIVLNKLYLATKIMSARQEIFKKINIIQTIRDKLINIRTDKDLEQFLNEFIFDDILLKKDLPETQKIEACIKFHNFLKVNSSKVAEYKEFIVLDPNNHKTHSLKKVSDIFEYIVPWIYIEFYDGDKSYGSLSSGEKMFLNFSINTMYQIRNIEKLEKQPYKTINLFLDEVEFGLHPDWQKRFIKEVFYMLKNFKSKFNLFYATHSPFILSDLAKENVIFLDKVDNKTKEKYPSFNIDDLKNGNCINVSKYIDIKPFGANIHTLLSHGFFMEDGLMGEFAKNKINKIIEFHKQVEEENKKAKKDFSDLKTQYENKKTEFWQTQKIIGEEYLKQVIKNHLIDIEKILLGKDEAKNAEIRRVEAYLESLKND